MSYIDQDNGNEKYIPYIIETSAGLTRNVLMFMCDAYEEQNLAKAGEPEDYRTVLHFHPKIAPVTVAVLPLKVGLVLSDCFPGIGIFFTVWLLL